MVLLFGAPALAIPLPVGATGEGLKVRGYVEDTLNVEYLRESGEESLLNTTRARIDLMAKPGP